MIPETIEQALRDFDWEELAGTQDFRAIKDPERHEWPTELAKVITAAITPEIENMAEEL